jgi:phosphoketolase
MVSDIHVDHEQYIREYGDDMPMVKNWTWGAYACGQMQ